MCHFACVFALWPLSLCFCWPSQEGAESADVESQDSNQAAAFLNFTLITLQNATGGSPEANGEKKAEWPSEAGIF